MAIWRRGVVDFCSCGRRSVAFWQRTDSGCTTVKARAVKRCASRRWPRWTAWSINGVWCTSPSWWTAGRRLTSGASRRERRGTRRSRSRWCVSKTASPFRPAGTDMCHIWAAAARETSSFEGKDSWFWCWSVFILEGLLVSSWYGDAFTRSQEPIILNNICYSFTGFWALWKTALSGLTHGKSWLNVPL